MKKFVFLTVSLLFAGLAVAQKKELTLEDAVLRGRSMLSPARLNQLSFIPQSESYAFTHKDKLVLTNPITESTDTLDALSIIRSQFKDINLQRFPLMNWVNYNEFFFVAATTIYTFNKASLLTRKVNRFPATAEDLDIHPNTCNTAYTINNGLYLHVNNEQVLIGEPEKDGIVYGKSVHRQEFGIEKGTFWSNSGSQLAFYRMDESMVSTYPIYALESKPAAAKIIRYPMAGDESHRVEVYIYDIHTKQNTKLNIAGAADQYITNISWTPDDQYVLAAILNRDQNQMQLNVYNAKSGAFIKTLFEEKQENYVEPLHPAIVTKDNRYVIWQSQRDGYNNLYLYDWNGKLIRQLTKDIIVLNVLKLDESEKSIYLSVVKPNSLTHYVMSVSLSSGKSSIIGDANTHTVQFWVSDKGTYSILHQSTSKLPRGYTIVQHSKNQSRVLFKPENPLNNYSIGKTEVSTIKADDGTLLFQRLIKPSNFDSTKKYPVMVYVYGGPHAQLITDAYLNGGELWMHYLANKGYIIYTLDNRGSSDRGLAFEQATFRQLGRVEMADQMRGISYLKSLPYVDANRIGVDGWSFGGFMTVSLLTRQPDVFKVGVAGGPVIDWSYYEVMYTERYMDTPQINEKGYAESSLFNYIDNLKGRLLIIHGTSDNVVLWQHSLKYIEACVKKGKQLDYFVYPGHEHNVVGQDRLHLIRKITDYFIEHL
ncbi:MAG: DPP IV N-terminal domain-containing protein [Bacteroidota bacterium]